MNCFWKTIRKITNICTCCGVQTFLPGIWLFVNWLFLGLQTGWEQESGERSMIFYCDSCFQFSAHPVLICFNCIEWAMVLSLAGHLFCPFWRAECSFIHLCSSLLIALTTQFFNLSSLLLASCVLGLQVCTSIPGLLGFLSRTFLLTLESGTATGSSCPM